MVFILKTNLIMEKIRSAYNPLEKFSARRSPGFRLSKKLYALHEHSMFLPQFPFRRACARAFLGFHFLNSLPELSCSQATVVLCAGSSRLPGLMRF